jgi:hypothetical protein
VNALSRQLSHQEIFRESIFFIKIMADLDDFFAKKDKKKKSKKAGLSTVELVKKLEETTLKEQEITNLEVLEEEEQAPVNSKVFEVNETTLKSANIS